VREVGETVTGGIYAELAKAKWRLRQAKRDNDQAEIDRLTDEVDVIMEVIFERWAEL
jgi:hypothetical protein